MTPAAEPIQTDNDLRRMIDELRRENNALRHRINKLEQIVDPVKHGHWEHVTGDIYKCSFCHMRVHVATCIGKPLFACCPFCKTDMGQVIVCD